MNFLARLVAACSAAALVLLPPAVHAQAPALPTVSQNQAQSAAFRMEEIEQLVAPIALYPDALIAQILMASTYPLEVVTAARWAKANPGIKDKALEDAMQQQPWDPSVKSLTAFPQVLQMMNEKLDMTQKLGDAFLAQQKDVLDAVQRLRARADQAGNLKSGKEQTVIKAEEGGQTVIKIEPANPQMLYVPTYDPALVYGVWPYPAYPPYYYYPPSYYYPPGYGYAAGAAFWGFTAGVIIGSALWGGCNWGGGGVYINHHNYNNFNRTNVKGGDWQHRPEHRKGVGYRDAGSQQRFGGGQRAGVDSREQFRGRADQGRQDIARGGADSFKGRGGADRAASMGNRGGIGDRGSPGAGARNVGGFSGVGGGGAQTRDVSNRGAASRSSAASTSRAGGGGARGGGARAGGGGRRR